MSRIRWYHYYFLLALFDVFVILLSLQLHGRTVASASELIHAATDLDEQSRWLQLAQQRILELNAPGNDLFRMEDYRLQVARFEVARRNMDETLQQAGKLHIPVALPTREIGEMVASAETVFAEFASIQRADVTEDVRREAIGRAGKAMARMDQWQHESLSRLGLVLAKNAEVRDRLLQEHESDLQSRITYERYFIAAVILILVGILWFGRRLQEYDRALQEQRRRLAEERRERLAAIGELCSSVAHGIRNPLAAIRSSAQLTLELGRMDDASQARLRDILEEGERLGDRVSGLLGMARASAEGFEFVSLGELVAGAVAELRPELERRQIGIQVEIAPEEIRVHGDRHQLEQVVVELLSNSMDHAKAGDCIRVACRRPSANGTAAIEVADEGPGVPEEIRSRIFDLFFTTKPGGTGIGLATIKRYARLHGGDVTLAPSERGARFLVTLPVARPGDFPGAEGRAPNDGEMTQASSE